MNSNDGILQQQKGVSLFNQHPLCEFPGCKQRSVILSLDDKGDYSPSSARCFDHMRKDNPNVS